MDQNEDMNFQQMMPKLIPEVDQVYPAYDSDTSLLTPDAKLSRSNVDYHHHQIESASSGGANSSDLSLKDGSGSESSLSLSDSDSESSNSTNAYYSLPMNSDNKGTFLQKTEEKKKKDTYEELLQKVAMYEDEIKVSNLRLQKSEEEVFWLKTELKRGAETLQYKEADLETEKRRVVELETKLAEDSWLVESQLKLARQEIESLKSELGSERKQVAALEESNLRYRNHQNFLEESIRELEELHTSLEHKLTLCESEKIEFRGEIIRLEDELICRDLQVEGLMKSYDKLEAERDRMRDEIHGQEIQKKEMEEDLEKLKIENGSAEKLVEELRLRGVELEKEVERKNGEMLAMAEEKREAIRQLCFSLEHYRSDYRELRDAIVGQKRVRVVA
ncbi:Protein NETWORKED 4A [Linum grandiflorum]